MAVSTHAGLPWVRELRAGLGERLHCWPFDGWEPAGRGSVLVEAYPALCSGRYPRAGRTGDQHDAYSLARWFAELDHEGILPALFHPALCAEDLRLGSIEGWIFGLLNEARPRPRPRPRGKHP